MEFSYDFACGNQRPPVLRLQNTVSDKEVEIPLQQELFSGRCSARLRIETLHCGLYLLHTPKSSIKISICPEISNIQMCTVFTHQVSSIIDRTQELPYNWLHITPLPKSGPSKSAYSMASFTDYQLTEEQIAALKKHQKILVDVVLNHMAPNSPILTENNTFNNINRPDLKSAIMMDVYL